MLIIMYVMACLYFSFFQYCGFENMTNVPIFWDFKKITHEK